jgi:hypothetical protein
MEVLRKVYTLPCGGGGDADVFAMLGIRWPRRIDCAAQLVTAIGCRS